MEGGSDPGGPSWPPVWLELWAGPSSLSPLTSSPQSWAEFSVGWPPASQPPTAHCWWLSTGTVQFSAVQVQYTIVPLLQLYQVQGSIPLPVQPDAWSGYPHLLLPGLSSLLEICLQPAPLPLPRPLLGPHQAPGVSSLAPRSQRTGGGQALSCLAPTWPRRRAGA